MNAHQLSPLFRTTIGFDHLASLLDATLDAKSSGGYPPYNIELVDSSEGDDRYVITLAVAGFRREDIELSVQDNTLTVRGAVRPADSAAANGSGAVPGASARRYLYRGIAERGFERKFRLADYVQVHRAKLRDGLLCIQLLREVPERLKRRVIDIDSGGAQTVTVAADQS